MGASAERTEHEIGRLREDMNASLREMQRRLQGGVSGIMGPNLRARRRELAGSVEAQARSVQGQARQNPGPLAVAGVVAAAAVGYGVVWAVGRWRESRRPVRRLRRGAAGIRGTLQQRVAESLQHLDQLRRGGVLLKVEEDKGGYLRVTDARLGPEPPKKPAKETTTDVVKRLVWALVLSISMALGSVFARRIATLVWESTVKEQPPDKNAVKK
jgi:hypothetical protein